MDKIIHTPQDPIEYAMGLWRNRRQRAKLHQEIQEMIVTPDNLGSYVFRKAMYDLYVLELDGY